MQTISFMTANYVARHVGYNMTEGWGQGDSASQAYFKPLDTFGERLEGYIRDIRALGFDALDLWTGVLHHEWATPEHIQIARTLFQQANMNVVSYAGGFGDTPEQFEKSCRLCVTLDIPVLGGGSGLLHTDRRAMIEILHETGRKFGYENHPEKTPEELLNKIGAGNTDVIGVAVDTGWFGTHGYDAADALAKVADRLFHVHLKDVRAAGGHDTCRYGEGVVPIRECVETLKRVGYTGAISVEHEPDFSDPTDDVKASYDMLKGWLS